MVRHYKTAIIVAKLHQTNRPVQQQDSSRSWEIQTVPNRKALVFLLWALIRPKLSRPCRTSELGG